MKSDRKRDPAETFSAAPSLQPLPTDEMPLQLLFDVMNPKMSVHEISKTHNISTETVEAYLLRFQINPNTKRPRRLPRQAAPLNVSQSLHAQFIADLRNPALSIAAISAKYAVARHQVYIYGKIHGAPNRSRTRHRIPPDIDQSLESQFVADLLDPGLSFDSIAAKYGIPRLQIYPYAKLHDAPRRERSYPLRNAPRHLNERLERQFITDLLNPAVSIHTVATKYHISKQQAYTYAKRHGAPPNLRRQSHHETTTHDAYGNFKTCYLDDLANLELSAKEIATKYQISIHTVRHHSVSAGTTPHTRKRHPRTGTLDDNQELRETTISIRLSADERADLKRKAKEHRRPVSDLVRLSIRANLQPYIGLPDPSQNNIHSPKLRSLTIRLSEKERSDLRRLALFRRTSTSELIRQLANALCADSLLPPDKHPQPPSRKHRAFQTPRPQWSKSEKHKARKIISFLRKNHFSIARIADLYGTIPADILLLNQTEPPQPNDSDEKPRRIRRPR